MRKFELGDKITTSNGKIGNIKSFLTDDVAMVSFGSQITTSNVADLKLCVEPVVIPVPEPEPTPIVVKSTITDLVIKSGSRVFTPNGNRGVVTSLMTMDIEGKFVGAIVEYQKIDKMVNHFFLISDLRLDSGKYFYKLVKEPNTTSKAIYDIFQRQLGELVFAGWRFDGVSHFTNPDDRTSLTIQWFKKDK
jgi:hypothetical protein